jgi:hypothetical protein
MQTLTAQEIQEVSGGYPEVIHLWISVDQLQAPRDFSMAFSRAAL